MCVRVCALTLLALATQAFPGSRLLRGCQVSVMNINQLVAERHLFILMRQNSPPKLCVYCVYIGCVLGVYFHAHGKKKSLHSFDSLLAGGRAF